MHRWPSQYSDVDVVAAAEEEEEESVMRQPGTRHTWYWHAAAPSVASRVQVGNTHLVLRSEKGGWVSK